MTCQQVSGPGPVVVIVCGGNAITAAMLEDYQREHPLGQ